MDEEPTTDLQKIYNRTLKFTAIHAFLLGLRTREGLSAVTLR